MLLLSFLVSLIAASAAVNCPFGSEFFEGSGHCYLSSKLYAHWRAAESICNHLGGHLATIQNVKENDFVYKAATKLGDNVWLGAHYVNADLINTDGTPVVFTNFQKGGFAITNDSVIAMNAGNPLNVLTNSKWTISQNALNKTLPFVCELPPCEDGHEPASLLKIFNRNSGLRYGPLTKSWYYGNVKTFGSFKQAQEACASVAGHLPTIVNLAHNLEVIVAGKEFGLSRPLPLGYRSGMVGKWAWDDGTNATYSNWATGFPLYQVEQRALVSLDNSFWFSATLFDILPKNYICQMPTKRRNTC